ncbi:MAG: hypothetical protein Tsb002_21630 [Wenzhouxiangellaceae bacterium]
MKPRTTLLLVFAIFLTPVLVATLMHSNWWHYQPQTRNYGELIEPVIKLAEFNAQAATGETLTAQQLLDRWTLLAVTRQPCAGDCLERATWLAQLRETQGRHLDRLQVLVVGATLPQTLPELPSGIQILQHQPQSTWLQTLPDNDINLQTTYLLDPAGNIILRYPPAADPTGMRKDLKRILTWSKADKES